ncbi:methyltransferase domain-containing protein [Luteibacter sp. NPDC031894]|uniref:methyltransferase domain-containing protein n=1 Tax=Luteibacter sp. NPDC031894 TaxID=3390572 RepID=UPI003D045EE6
MSSLKTLQSHPLRHDASMEDIHALGPWFHNLHLPDGRQTAPDHPLGDYPAYKCAALAPHLPSNLADKRVLDIGCNAGYFAIELARRGAHVTAIDHDAHYLRQAAWAAEQFDLGDRLVLKEGDVYGLAGSGDAYDIVLFLGVFYHLRYPLLGLDLAASMSSGLLLFQSLATGGSADDLDTSDPGYLGRDRLREDAWPKLAFIEHELAGDPTNWWLPNPPALRAMVRSAGFAVDTVVDDIHICRRTSAATSAEQRLHAVLGSLCGPQDTSEEARHVR